MKNPIAILAAASLLLQIFSCQKEKTTLPVFKEIATPTAEKLTAVWFLNEKIGFLTGGELWQNGFILSTNDGGATWQTDTSLPKRLESIQFDSDGRGYACGLDGRLLTRAPFQKNWQMLREDWQWHRAVFFKNENLGAVVGGEGFVNGKLSKFSENFRRDTVFEFENELDAVWFSSDSTAHAAGMGQILNSRDGGKTWLRRDVPSDFYQALHFLTEKIGFACGASGTILRTDDGGATWQTLRDGHSKWVSDSPFRSIFFRDEKNGFVVGDDGLFWRTADGGKSWLEIENAPSGVDFTKIFLLGNRGWLTADGGKFFYFED